MIVSVQELQRFCYTWKQFSDYARMHLQGDRVLHLQFEDLLADSENWISKVELFTGVTSIDRDVLNVKVNTYKDDPKLVEHGGTFLKPDDLTAVETEIINSFL